MTKQEAKTACEAAEEARNKASRERAQALARLAYGKPEDFARYEAAHQVFVTADIAASEARERYWQLL